MNSFTFVQVPFYIEHGHVWDSEDAMKDIAGGVRGEGWRLHLDYSMMYYHLYLWKKKL